MDTWNDMRKTKQIVLARIPDLNAAGMDAEADGHSGDELPASGGRLIDQALSFKLLAGVALLLLVGAIIPLSTGKKNPPTDPPSTTAAPLTAWRPRPPAAQNGAAAQTPTHKPATLIPATPERSPAPVALPPQTEVKSQPPSSQKDDLPRMSHWPNPAQAGPR